MLIEKVRRMPREGSALKYRKGEEEVKVGGERILSIGVRETWGADA